MISLSSCWSTTPMSFTNSGGRPSSVFGIIFSNRYFPATSSFSVIQTRLLEDYTPADRERRQIIGGGTHVDVDDTDIRILQLMADNARIPITDIADRLEVSTAKVLYRINQLMERKVIQGYRTNFDLNMLGYKQFKVDIDFKDYNSIDSVTPYLVSDSHLYYITRTAGHSDLEPTFRVRNLRHLHEVMDQLIDTFPNAIKNYQHFYMTQMNKLHYMPNIVTGNK